MIFTHQQPRDMRSNQPDKTDWSATETTLRSMHAKLKDVLPKRKRT